MFVLISFEKQRKNILVIWALVIYLIKKLREQYQTLPQYKELNPKKLLLIKNDSFK